LTARAPADPAVFLAGVVLPFPLAAFCAAPFLSAVPPIAVDAALPAVPPATFFAEAGLAAVVLGFVAAGPGDFPAVGEEDRAVGLAASPWAATAWAPAGTVVTRVASSPARSRVVRVIRVLRSGAFSDRGDGIPDAAPADNPGIP
jgi:hypothetical protein